jgi:hypothetical protein
METFTAVLSGIPLWVYPLFTYGVYSGVRGCFVRNVRVGALVVLPLLFLGLSVSSLVGVLSKAPLVLVLYLLFLVLGATLGWFFLTREPVSVDKGKAVLRVAGSALGLGMFVVIFTVKFAFGFESAVAPDVAMGPWFLTVVFGASGIISGVATGRSSRLFAYFRD